MRRLGVVSFLNSRPLIHGLPDRGRAVLRYDVPARLPALLERGAVDAALIPVVDVLRAPERFRVVSDACIGSDGETMTVRVFSHVPPDRVRSLAADADSHTSIALADVLWSQLFDRRLELRALRRETDRAAAPASAIETGADALLLIGDKVVDPRREGFAYEVDLGGAWRALTGLPFVFAVWAARAADGIDEDLGPLLEAARDRGVAAAVDIARIEGPAHGWPASLAERYLTRCLCYTLDERMRAGMRRFAELCAALDLSPAPIGA